MEQEKDVVSKPKLPKFKITKFKGTHLDWLIFWEQCDVEIDRSNLTIVTNFSYLKYFVDPNMRILTDGLSFTSEEYNRAKSILSARCGRACEVVNARIQLTMQMSTTNETNPQKINEFYDNLITQLNILDIWENFKASQKTGISDLLRTNFLTLGKT